MVTKEPVMADRIVKLTKRRVDATQPEAERYILWDSGLKGFGLRVEASGTKAFLVRYRIAGRKRFVMIGHFGQLTPEQARSLAQETLASVRHGHNPADERRKERAALLPLVFWLSTSTPSVRSRLRSIIEV